MKKLTKITAFLLCIAMLAASLAGCNFMYGTGELGGEDEETTAPEADNLYLENYYVNKHTPVAKKGGMEIYKYDGEEYKTFTLGGHDYNGGIRFWNKAGPIEYADIEFPLDGQYKSFSFVLSGNGTEKLVDRVVDGKDH